MPAGVFCSEVARKAIFSPDLNVSGLAFAFEINKDRADWRGVWIVYGKLLKTVVADEFISGLLGQFSFRTRCHCTRGEERFLDVMPATRFRVGVGPFVSNCGRAHQVWAQPRIDFGHRMNYLAFLVLLDHRSRCHFAVSIFKDELGLKSQGFVFGGRGRNGQSAATEND